MLLYFQNNSPLQPQDISLITTNQEGKIPPSIVQGLQCFFESIQRHGLGMMKLMADSGKNPIREVGQDPGLLVKGFKSRFAYEMLATYPSLVVSQMVDKETPKYQISALTAFFETSIGTPLEVNGSRNSLKTLGKDITSITDFAYTSRAAFLPFMCRNYLGWLVINGDEKDPVKKAGLGGLAGLMSSPLDSLGNMAMLTSDSSKTLTQTYLEAVKKIKFTDMVKAAPIRFVASAVTTVVLSNQTKEFLSEVLNPLYQAAMRSEPKNPQTNIEAISTAKLIKELEQVNER